MELEEIVEHTSSETITEYIAYFGVLQGSILSFLKSMDEWRNGHLDEQQSIAAYWGLHSFFQLTPLMLCKMFSCIKSEQSLSLRRSA